jgi:hypothetical protein
MKKGKALLFPLVVKSKYPLTVIVVLTKFYYLTAFCCFYCGSHFGLTGYRPAIHTTHPSHATLLRHFCGSSGAMGRAPCNFMPLA